MSATSFLIFAASAFAIITALCVIIKKAREYEMRVFINRSFGVLWVGFIVAMCAYKMITPPETAEIASCVSLLLAVLASAYLNIKKSNFLFGLIFTITQIFMFALSFMIVFLIFLKFKKEL